MIILGICNDETASACLMVDGEIICAASEERFTRVKLDNSFPRNAIQFCLEFLEIKLSEIDTIAYAWSKGFNPELLEQYLSMGSQYANDEIALGIVNDRLKWEISRDKKKRQEFDLWVDENIDLSKQKVLDFYHHEAHAASASLVSNFDDGYVYTSDGRGDFESTTIYKFSRNSSLQLEKIFSSTSSQSFGYYYGRITGLLGYKPMRHEGKITGLAAYGDSKKTLALCKKMIEVKNGKIVAHLGDYYRPFFNNYSSKLQNEVSKHKKEDVAAAAQDHLENMMEELLDHHLKINNAKNVNLMCAGGVFGNVKVTQRLKEMSSVSNVYVQPQMGDGGLCIGACALANEALSTSGPRQKERVTKALNSMYLGPYAKINDEEYNNIYKDIFKKYSYSVLDAPAKFVKSLQESKIIGLINGRMEFGPRALCNRSIIVGTADKSINDWLNKRLNRTEFMPFAPVIRKEVATRCIKEFQQNDVTLNFMTSTVDCTEEFEQNNPAVVHIDHTARPQIVTEESNNFIWNVLKLWESTDSEMSLVNTSFNVHEEPIVCNVNEGFISLKNKVIDELWHVDNDKVICYSLS